MTDVSTFQIYQYTAHGYQYSAKKISARKVWNVIKIITTHLDILPDCISWLRYWVPSPSLYMWAHHILVPGWCMCACVFWLQAHTWLNKSPSWTKQSNFRELKRNKNDHKSLRRFQHRKKPKPILPINSSIAPYERRQTPSLIKKSIYFIFLFSFSKSLQITLSV